MVVDKKYLIVSFSGGESSAYMLYRLLKEKKLNYEKVVVLFANTGQENEETLTFVKNVGEWLNIHIIWLEAVISPRHGVGTKHKIVDYETACRNKFIFEEMIKKYGIPNTSYNHCTRELKLRPIESYLKRELMITPKDYDMCIGIRSDEIDRMSSEAIKKGLRYPMIEWFPTTKYDVNKFWDSMTFRLELKGYQGNCKWCWKKSKRKHFTILEENPEFYDTPEYFETMYGYAGARPKGATGPRVFFRGNMSTLDLKRSKEESNWTPADDDSVYVFDPDLDVGGGCEESCEISFD